MRLIINKKLVGVGYGKFGDVYRLNASQQDIPLFIPKEKEVFLQFAEDRFWVTPQGSALKKYIESLKSTGQAYDFFGERKGELRDINGLPVKGKKLKDISVITEEEAFLIDYKKRESDKVLLKEAASLPVSEKMLAIIERRIMCGIILESIGDDLNMIIKELHNNYGVEISMNDMEKFANLYVELNNNSNLWVNNGYSPRQLVEEYGFGFPHTVEFGPNIREMIDRGEYDINELRDELKKYGIKLDE